VKCSSAEGQVLPSGQHEFPAHMGAPPGHLTLSPCLQAGAGGGLGGDGGVGGLGGDGGLGGVGGAGGLGEESAQKVTL